MLGFLFQCQMLLFFSLAGCSGVFLFFQSDCFLDVDGCHLHKTQSSPSRVRLLLKQKDHQDHSYSLESKIGLGGPQAGAAPEDHHLWGGRHPWILTQWIGTMEGCPDMWTTILSPCHWPCISGIVPPCLPHKVMWLKSPSSYHFLLVLRLLITFFYCV